MNRNVNRLCPTPGDRTVTELGVMLLADARRKNPGNDLAALEEAYENVLNHMRTLVAGSPRALAEVRDQVSIAKRADERLRIRAGDNPLEFEISMRNAFGVQS